MTVVRSLSRAHRSIAEGEAKKLSPALKKAARERAPGKKLSKATLASLVAKGLAVDRGNGKWHWTALGRLTVSALEAQDAEKARDQ